MLASKLSETRLNPKLCSCPFLCGLNSALPPCCYRKGIYGAPAVYTAAQTPPHASTPVVAGSHFNAHGTAHRPVCTRVLGCPTIPPPHSTPAPEPGNLWRPGRGGGVGMRRNNNEGKGQGGAARKPPGPSSRWSFCKCLQWVCRLQASRPWGRGVTRAVCHSESSGSQEGNAGHHKPLDICKAVGHWVGAYLTTRGTGGACVQVSEAPSLHNSREQHRQTSQSQQISHARHCLPAHAAQLPQGTTGTLRV